MSGKNISLKRRMENCQEPLPLKKRRVKRKASSQKKQNETEIDYERYLRKTLRVGNKMLKAAGNACGKLTAVGKVLKFKEAVYRYRRCIQDRSILECATAEGVNQMTRFGVVSAGYAGITTSIPLMLAPTGITQLGAAGLASSSMSIIFKADDYGSAMSQLVHTTSDALAQVWRGRGEIKKEAKKIQNLTKKVKEEEEDKRWISPAPFCPAFHPRHFDSTHSQGYTKHAEKFRANPKPTINVVPRLPDIRISSKNDWEIKIPLIIIQFATA